MKAKRKKSCTCDACRNAKKDAAVAALRVLVGAVDALRDEGFDGLAVRARYVAVLQANDRAAATLTYLDGKEARKP